VYNKSNKNSGEDQKHTYSRTALLKKLILVLVVKKIWSFTETKPPLLHSQQSGNGTSIAPVETHHHISLL
jgi:hypothetical protein